MSVSTVNNGSKTVNDISVDRDAEFAVVPSNERIESSDYSNQAANDRDAAPPDHRDTSPVLSNLDFIKHQQSPAKPAVTVETADQSVSDQATAPIAANDVPNTTSAPAVPVEPTAAPKELEAMDDYLDNPLRQELITVLGQGASTPTGDSAITTGLIDRYGPDRFADMVGLHNAMNVVQKTFTDALTPVLIAARDQYYADYAVALNAWRATHQEGTGDFTAPPFDLSGITAEFTKEYCSRDDLVCRGFNYLYSDEAVTELRLVKASSDRDEAADKLSYVVSFGRGAFSTKPVT